MKWWNNEHAECKGREGTSTCEKEKKCKRKEKCERARNEKWKKAKEKQKKIKRERYRVRKRRENPTHTCLGEGPFYRFYLQPPRQ